MGRCEMGKSGMGRSGMGRGALGLDRVWASATGRWWGDRTSDSALKSASSAGKSSSREPLKSCAVRRCAAHRVSSTYGTARGRARAGHASG